MTALAIGLSMWLFYVLASINTRVCAQGRYVSSMLSDGMIATVQFSLIQRVASASTWAERGAYIVGGMLGGVSGIWMTKWWYGE